MYRGKAGVTCTTAKPIAMDISSARKSHTILVPLIKRKFLRKVVATPTAVNVDGKPTAVGKSSDSNNKDQSEMNIVPVMNSYGTRAVVATSSTAHVDIQAKAMNASDILMSKSSESPTKVGHLQSPQSCITIANKQNSNIFQNRIVQNKCQRCKTYFTSKDSLEKHNSLFHMVHTCVLCGKAFRNVFAMRTHMKCLHTLKSKLL